MKITIAKKTLLAALAVCKTVTERKSTLPAIPCVLISASGDGTVKLTATNLYREVHLTIQASEVGKPGQCLVNVFELFERLSVFSDGLVHLTEDDRKLLVQAGSRKHRLHTLPPEDAVPTGNPPDNSPPAVGISIATATLHNLIETVRDNAAVDKDRPALNCIKFEFRPGEVRACATSGHTLGLCVVKRDDLTAQCVALIPQEHLSALETMPAGETTRISICGPYAWFVSGSAVFGCRTVDLEFPHYERALPQHKDVAVISRQELTSAVRNASAAAKSLHDISRFEFTRGVVTISGESPASGDAEDELKINYSSKPFTVGLNSQYVLNALKALSTDDVRMSFDPTNDMGAVIFRNTDDDNTIRLLMPCRL